MSYHNDIETTNPNTSIKKNNDTSTKQKVISAKESIYKKLTFLESYFLNNKYYSSTDMKKNSNDEAPNSKKLISFSDISKASAKEAPAIAPSDNLTKINTILAALNTTVSQYNAQEKNKSGSAIDPNKTITPNMVSKAMQEASLKIQALLQEVPNKLLASTSQNAEQAERLIKEKINQYKRHRPTNKI